jgi:hypothetical protein
MSDRSISVAASPPAQVLVIAATLRLFGRIGFWVQLLLIAISSVVLFFSIFSRNIDNEGNNAATGAGISLAIGSILLLCFTTSISFRYGRFAKRLHNPSPAIHPSKDETTRLVRLSVLISLIGLGISLVGTELSTSILLAKQLAQPQGVAVYSPEKIIRVLDVLVVLINATIAFGHFLSNLLSLWLLHRLDRI